MEGAPDCRASERGDRYLRTLLIHGGSRRFGSSRRQTRSPKPLADKLRERRHPNVAAVALANKNARIVWAMLSSDTVYDASLSVRRSLKANPKRKDR